MIPSQSDLYSSDDGTLIKAIPSMSLTNPKVKKDGTYTGNDKNGAEYSIRIEDTDLIHSKTKKPGYRIHFVAITTRLSFISFEGNSIDIIKARLEKIGYKFSNH